MRRPQVPETHLLKAPLALPLLWIPTAWALGLRGGALVGASALYSLFASCMAVWLRGKSVEMHRRAAMISPVGFGVVAAASFLVAAFTAGFEGGSFGFLFSVAMSGAIFWITVLVGFAHVALGWGIWRGAVRLRLTAP